MQRFLMNLAKEYVLWISVILVLTALFGQKFVANLEKRTALVINIVLVSVVVLIGFFTVWDVLR